VSSSEAPILLSMRGIHVAYGNTRALNGVDFDLYHGEIHALVGEHRAGKSSLVKLLSGAERRRAGEIVVEGRRIGNLSPREAQSLGIGIVYQDPSVIPDLNAVENIFAGQMPRVLVHQRRMLDRARVLFDRIGFAIDFHAPLHRLSAVQRHMVEFARALLTEPRILILDELANKLTPEEMKKVYRIIFELKERGSSVVYISHDMDEVLKLADRVTILKNGYRRETVPVRNLDRFRLFELTYSFRLNQEKMEYTETRFSLLRRYLVNIVQSFPVGVILLDLDARIQLINYAAVDILDAKHLALEQTPIDGTLKLDPQRHADLLDALRSGKPRTWEDLHYGDNKLLRIDVQPLVDDNGTCIGTTMIVTDVSMSRTISDYLIQTEKMASVAEVAVGVAHEINNPLFIIQNYVELIKSRIHDGETAERIGRIEAELERIVEIITSLLSFSRMKDLPERQVNLREVVDEVLILLQHSLAEKRIQVATEYPDGDVAVVGDENRLKQVFINLVRNSIDAVLDMGRIGVRIARLGDPECVEVAIQDNGSGIPDEVADKVFSPFFSTKISNKNAGLGLSISRQIVEEHQGKITFKSVPGRSTTFAVRLPVP
jgi:two-component system, NtrC family, sensor histidine kinase AtoS